MNIIKYLIVFCLFMNIRLNVYGQDRRLVWSDEFNYTGLPDSTKWSNEQGMIRNNEAQYYTNKRIENARVEKGNLVIEARKEHFKYGKYTSASIETIGKRQFLYGRIEMRAKLPLGRGTWPAMWLLGTDIADVGWPACGEIDIMEYVGFDSLQIHGNINTTSYNHSINTYKGKGLIVDKPWETFHIYAIEWSHEKIDFYCDSTKYFTFENDFKGNNDTWPYDKPHYLILNLAIGGSWGGQKGIDNSKFSQKYYIDYVRYYSAENKNEYINRNAHSKKNE